MSRVFESIQVFKCCAYLLVLLIKIILIISMCVFPVNGDLQKDFYIVYMGDSPVVKDNIADFHVNLLSDVCGSVGAAKDSIVHSYTKHFNAIAAKLSPQEAKKLESSSGVISVYPNRYHKLHTTKTWDFMGFTQNIKRNLKVESKIIVGLLDTGITPGSESFSDKGFGPPPAKWKGSCGPFTNFSGCNNKLIGAKYFKLDGFPDPSDILSPVDVEGHGSHTSSTLAGNLVRGASLNGLAKGTARGAVPSARIAMYKVCWANSGCSDMDLLAGFESAIEDGVDIISISIGGSSENYLKDSIGIGSFHAMKKGILTVASGGNDGPSLASVVNHAPWILTVAATGINRQFISKVMLGNGKFLSGIGINSFQPKQKLYPLINGADAGFNSSGDPFGERYVLLIQQYANYPHMHYVLFTEKNLPELGSLSMYCMEDSLDPKKVKGKLVLCELQQWGVDSVVKKVGGIGTLVKSSYNPDTAQIFMAPGTMINYTGADIVTDYIRSTKSPSAVIYRTQEVRVLAPVVASFSSRGPSMGSHHVLKPDISAPGIDILAAYTPLRTLTGLEGDTQHSKYTIMSGTSMACPHVAGIAAYVKSFHPGWSPAAIKSAIITTAIPMSSKVNPGAEFSYGAGQLNPLQAVHPGLIYDMDQLTYIQFLCNEGYKNGPIRVIVGSKTVNCSQLPPPKGTDALNYPTMQLSMKTTDSKPGVAIFRRRVTNVGPIRSIYNATINGPKNVEITVRPMSLIFTKRFQKKSFTVVVRAKKVGKDEEIISGSLVWKSDIHTVRSPIVVYTSEYY